MTFRKISLTFLIITLGASCAYAKKGPKYEQAHQLTPEQAALVERAIAQEKVLIKNIQQRTPLVETYIQNTRPDVHLYQVPVEDQYILSRVDFGRGFFDKTYQPRAGAKHGFFKGSFSAITGLSKALGLERFTYNPTGFMQMMFLDPYGFDSQHYIFSYVRREFLGSVRTWVFDVHPKVNGMGRFYGRIWIEDQDGNVVRFNGTYTAPTSEDSSKYFFHFDSWRMNVQPGIWLPVAVYVEETNRIEGEKTVGLKAQTHFWGYSLKLPTRDSENVSVKVDDAVNKTDDSQDVGPLQATRAWVTQAENNVIDRLVEAGLVAPLNQGGFENKTLDQLVINLQCPTTWPSLTRFIPASCSPLRSRQPRSETPSSSARGLSTACPAKKRWLRLSRWNSRTLPWGTTSTPVTRSTTVCFSPTNRHSSASTCTTPTTTTPRPPSGPWSIWRTPSTRTSCPSAGLYYAQLVNRSKVLKALNTPKLGDSLLKPDGTPWMADLAKMSPKLNWDDLAQRPAIPLGFGSKPIPGTTRCTSLTQRSMPT